MVLVTYSADFVREAVVVMESEVLGLAVSFCVLFCCLGASSDLSELLTLLLWRKGLLHFKKKIPKPEALNPKP